MSNKDNMVHSICLLLFLSLFLFCHNFQSKESRVIFLIYFSTIGRLAFGYFSTIWSFQACKKSTLTPSFSKETKKLIDIELKQNQLSCSSLSQRSHGKYSQARRQLPGCHGGLTVYDSIETPESQFTFVKSFFQKSKGSEHLLT